MTPPLRGRYQPLGVVGAGAQGEVLCARDLVHDRLVAIKVRRVPSDAERTEILTEARTLLGVRPHPGIALAREDFFEAGRYHLVMDWVQGVDLARWLADAGPDGVPFTDVLHVLSQVADALDHLHTHDPPVVHKDVKPANIVIDRDGRAVLVDFGLSGRPAAADLRAGTRGYKAPEVSSGETPGTAADVFSLAATAYFCFTGLAPEPGATVSWPGVPAEQVSRLQAALARGLSLDPCRRPPSARALVELLAPPAVPHNLPAPLTRFVGRDRELSELTRALGGTRLLTLTGMGGVGKTRLATELASQESWAYPAGVWLVELGPLGDDAFVVPAIAKVVGVREAAGRSLLETLADRFRDQPVLLVLDNCEHLLDAAAHTAEVLLKTAPGLRILATSRQPLDVFGEVPYRVPPLATPEPGTPSPSQDLAAYESVVLFCDRARSADPDFALRPDNTDSVFTICRRLDGIPLALEMAAARLRQLPVDDLASSLTSMELTGARTAPSRQRTLAATVAWSYDLLPPPASALFRRLSAFAGGFDVEAAAAVCAGDEVPTARVGELLHDLVQASMVVVRGPGWYGLLETLRQYAEGRLTEHEGPGTFADRHLAWFLAVAEKRENLLFGPAEGQVLAAFERDVDNVRAALRRSIERADTGAAFRLSRALSRYWNVRAYWSEGRSWLEEILAAAPSAPAVHRARALTAAAVMAENQGDFRAATQFGQEGLRLARAVGDGATAAEALNSLSNVAQAEGNQDKSNRLLDECLATWRSCGTVRGMVSSFAGALGAVGWRATWQGRYAEARWLFGEAMEVAEQLKIRRARVNCLMGLATVAEAEGRLDEARGHVDEARTISRELGDKRFLGMQLLLDGLIALGEGDDNDAAAQFLAALREAVAAGDQVLFVRTVEGLVRVAAGSGHPSRAATLLGNADALREAMPWPVSPVDRAWRESSIAALRDRLGGDVFEGARARGRTMSSDDVERLALVPAARET